MNAQKEKKSVSVLAFGQTGVGKSYFLNLMAQSNNPKEGPFYNLLNLQSVTKECSNQIAELDIDKFQMTINLIDTPGIFDTEDPLQIGGDKYPASIENIIKILDYVKENNNSQINRILIVMQADSRQTNMVKGMFEIAKILIGQDLKIIGIINKCQKIYDDDNDDSQKKLNQLKACKKQWKEQFKNCGVEDVICVGGLSLKKLENCKTMDDEIKGFYKKQWFKLFAILKKSINVQLTEWNNLTKLQKDQIGVFFNYKFKNQEYKFDQFGSKEDFNYQQKQNRFSQKCKQNNFCEPKQGGCLSLNVDVLDSSGQALSIKHLMNQKTNLLGRNKNNINLGLLFSSPGEKEYLQIKFVGNYRKNYVECSNHHLIFCSNRNNFIRADELTLDDQLLYSDGNKQTPVKIMEISKVIVQGCYSPLTTSGEFFGNGILFSCYTSFNPKIINQTLAHIAVLPLILYRRVMPVQEIKTESQKEEFKIIEYEPNYTKFLKWFYKK